MVDTTETDVIEGFASPEADSDAREMPLAPASRDAEYPKEIEDFLLAIGWRKDYNRTTYRCCNGDQWCNTDDLGCDVDEQLPLYDRAVLGTTAFMVNVMVGIGSVFLKLGHFRRVRVGRVYYNGKHRLTRLERCP